jgi:hypothetical protein
MLLQAKQMTNQQPESENLAISGSQHGKLEV